MCNCLLFSVFRKKNLSMQTLHCDVEQVIWTPRDLNRRTFGHEARSLPLDYSGYNTWEQIMGLLNKNANSYLYLLAETANIYPYKRVIVRCFLALKNWELLPV
jgi:hypothetical protein